MVNHSTSFFLSSSTCLVTQLLAASFFFFFFFVCLIIFTRLKCPLNLKSSPRHSWVRWRITDAPSCVKQWEKKTKKWRMERSESEWPEETDNACKDHLHGISEFIQVWRKIKGGFRLSLLNSTGLCLFFHSCFSTSRSILSTHVEKRDVMFGYLSFYSSLYYLFSWRFNFASMVRTHSHSLSKTYSLKRECAFYCRVF